MSLNACHRFAFCPHVGGRMSNGNRQCGLGAMMKVSNLVYGMYRVVMHVMTPMDIEVTSRSRPCHLGVKTANETVILGHRTSMRVGTTFHSSIRNLRHSVSNFSRDRVGFCYVPGSARRSGSLHRN